ncbi:hypothetical protein GC101_11415 [Paenibacillus sp. LMG 31459]|uniref:Uncharacterized protein n=1 Tax=Paenibacillus phytohabitans TaxID=2654978 RepID=A0ABX1YHQ1_9BACL|nr:hypothetical protein [Paenibacillus phytohabitans]NOU79486.1 hypothetical protein [Paenibacillus phytohabitans]
MKYFQNRVGEMEGLCNQLMAIFRTVSEAFHSVEQGEPSCILLADGQTRNSIEMGPEPFFSPVSIDAFIEVDRFEKVLAARNVSLKRMRDAEIDRVAVSCSRFPVSSIPEDEARTTGAWIARTLPFAAKPLKLAHYIIGWMSSYPKWAAIQLRIEDDIMYFEANRSMGLDGFAQLQVQQAAGELSQIPAVSAIYVATGASEDFLRHSTTELTIRFPEANQIHKKDILSLAPKLWEEFEAMSLEEQALVDWLVCLGAPYFLGPHGTSFSYLAGYMRHYRGFDSDLTRLWPEYQQYWDLWFPRL